MICDSRPVLAPLESGDVRAPAGAPLAPITLWLVDDNRRLRMTLQDLFSRCPGIQCVETFHSPNAVLSALASRVGPDVILLDMNLGEHNGLDAIRAIKSLSRSTQVLMLTTFFDQEAARRAVASGASGFLLKSFPLERIVAAVRQAWQNPAPHLKRSRQPEAANAPKSDGATASQSTPPRSLASASGPVAPRTLGWVKQALDVIRNLRKSGPVEAGLGKH